MFIDKDYRKKVVNKVSDPVVKAFWLNEFTKYSSQFTVDAISPIQNKVGQFLSSSLVRNIIAQTHSTIDMREIMDNKKILVINLAKGKIGEDYSALLGAMLITKIQLAAMGRSDIPEEERKDFYLYVDEFQNFATESFAGILSEARKYRLNLIIAHQYIGQLEEEVRDSVFGNVGTIITFRVGAADAEFLEKEFEPVFMMNDIVNLTKYDIYLKLMIDGVTGDAFSATTLPPSEVTEQSNIEKIIRVSRERYANKREVVEEKISRWSGMGDEDKKMENNDNKKGNESREIESKNNISKNEEKEMWDAVCEICGEKIKVPFKPDPKRSTYCKNCLVEVRKQVVESVQNNKTGNTDFKKEEKKEICQTEKAEIKTTDSKNSFVGRDVNERKEKSFSVSNNFQIQKNKEVFEKQSNAIIEDDSSKKNVSVEKINQPNHKDLPKSKLACPAGRDLEIKEGEVVKF
jgi:CxxC-x17-CxxC domain-containing protein